MFQIIPVPPEEISPLFGGQALPPGALPAAVRLMEDGETKGLGRFYVNLFERCAVLLELKYPGEDVALADALFRAMLHFALNRGIETADVSAVTEDHVVRGFLCTDQLSGGRLRIADFFGSCGNCGNC